MLVYQYEFFRMTKYEDIETMFSWFQTLVSTFMLWTKDIILMTISRRFLEGTGFGRQVDQDFNNYKKLYKIHVAQIESCNNKDKEIKTLSGQNNALVKQVEELDFARKFMEDLMKKVS